MEEGNRQQTATTEIIDNIPLYHSFAKSIRQYVEITGDVAGGYKLYEAIALFGMEGIEPDLNDIPGVLWELIKPNLVNARNKRLAGRKGGEATKRNNPNGRRGGKQQTTATQKTEKRQPQQTAPETPQPDTSTRPDNTPSRPDNTQKRADNTQKHSEFEEKKRKTLKSFFSNRQTLQSFCMNKRTTAEEVMKLCNEIFTEWELTKEPDVSEKHLLNTLRIKLNCLKDDNRRNSKGNFARSKLSPEPSYGLIE